MTTPVVIRVTAKFNDHYEARMTQVYYGSPHVPKGMYRLGVKAVSLRCENLQQKDMVFITIAKGSNKSYIGHWTPHSCCSLKTLVPNDEHIKKDFTQCMEYATVPIPYSAAALMLTIFDQDGNPLSMKGTVLIECIGDESVVAPVRFECG